MRPSQSHNFIDVHHPKLAGVHSIIPAHQTNQLNHQHCDHRLVTDTFAPKIVFPPFQSTSIVSTPNMNKHTLLSQMQPCDAHSGARALSAIQSALCETSQAPMPMRNIDSNDDLSGLVDSITDDGDCLYEMSLKVVDCDFSNIFDDEQDDDDDTRASTPNIITEKARSNSFCYSNTSIVSLDSSSTSNQADARPTHFDTNPSGSLLVRSPSFERFSAFQLGLFIDDSHVARAGDQSHASASAEVFKNINSINDSNIAHIGTSYQPNQHQSSPTDFAPTQTDASALLPATATTTAHTTQCELTQLRSSNSSTASVRTQGCSETGTHDFVSTNVIEQTQTQQPKRSTIKKRKTSDLAPQPRRQKRRTASTHRNRSPSQPSQRPQLPEPLSSPAQAARQVSTQAPTKSKPKAKTPSKTTGASTTTTTTTTTTMKQQMIRLKPSDEIKWQLRYGQMKEFVQQNGHALVPLDFKPNPPLSHWVKRQRCQYKAKQNGRKSVLTDQRQQLLEQLGFVWDSHRAVWEARFRELMSFREEYKHCNVPAQHPDHPALSVWVKCQRRQYKLYTDNKRSNMTTERIERLSSVGFVWKPRMVNSSASSSSSSTSSSSSSL